MLLLNMALWIVKIFVKTKAKIPPPPPPPPFFIPPLQVK